MNILLSTVLGGFPTCYEEPDLCRLFNMLNKLIIRLFRFHLGCVIIWCLLKEELSVYDIFSPFWSAWREY